MAHFPDAIDKSKVGTYDGATFSGGGYFYDEVLEYRVWCHPEDGAADLYDGEDYFQAFDNYNAALDYFNKSNGAEEPIVLVWQKEYIDEPEEGKYFIVKKERITEWLPEWLEGSKRVEDSLENFIKENS